MNAARSPPPFSRGWHSRVYRPFAAVPLLYFAWLAMMCAHELGHVMHGYFSGATLSAVRIPLAGFSVTEFSTNPRPHFVAWGGAVWGCVLPMLAWGLFHRRRWPGRAWLQFFAGFCLVTNGVYLGAGWGMRAGDAGDLVRYGTSVWVLVTFGIAATGTGLYLWHRLGSGPVLKPLPRPADPVMPPAGEGDPP